MSTTKSTRAKSARSKSPTPPAPKYVLVSNGDDWEGFYVDGVLMRQNHKLRTSDIFSAMGIDLDMRWVSYDYTAERGDLPEKLGDIPADAFHD